jgi:putative CocE/NonD family hydrolase
MDIIVEKDVPVRMRDGVELATDVYRPLGEGRFPTLVQRLPYGKEQWKTVNLTFDVLRGVQHGYAVVVQDTRGRWASGGRYRPFIDEGRDGADTVAWAARARWSTGDVGMIGGSYFGATQWLAAAERPDALRTIAPFITGSSPYEGWTYQGGAFALGFALSWTLAVLALGEVIRRMRAGAAGPEEFASLIRAVDANDELYRRTPLIEVPELGDLAPYYREWLLHPAHDTYWRAAAPDEHYEKIVQPTLNVGGWYDNFQTGTLANYCGMRQRGGSEPAQQPHLVMGPWTHAVAGGSYAERSYGLLAESAVFDTTGYQLRWFDRFVRGHRNGVDAERPVKLFVMGIDAWRAEDDWPLPDTEWQRWYLHSAGAANSADGNGSLSPQAPGDEEPDAYLYDPRRPVPTCGGSTFLPGLAVAANAGPRDQRWVERRSDVLVYTSAPLPRDLEVTGPIELVLFASSSAADTDFTGKLVDVHPDGRAEILTDGILRARYRRSLAEPEPLESGKIEELRIDLQSTANVFRTGHRIRLEVSSSNFPRFDRNSNTGGAIALEREEDFVQALNRVHHDQHRPSHVVLPIIERV